VADGGEFQSHLPDKRAAVVFDRPKRMGVYGGIMENEVLYK